MNRAADSSRSRRRRAREEAAARHRGEPLRSDFADGFTALAHLALDGAQISARAVDLTDGRPLLSVDDHTVLPVSGVGKMLVLLEAAARIEQDEAARLQLLDRIPADAAGGPGLWQHLAAPSLPLIDVATLVAATSDGLATNVLLRALGLDAVRRRGEAVGLKRTALLDRVRERRGPDDAPQLAVGSAVELAGLLAAVVRGEAVDRGVSSRLASWLALGVDTSMVASAFGLDPVAHAPGDRDLELMNRTGWAPGVRAEAGVLRGPKRAVAYAVLVAFQETEPARRLAVLQAMRTVGTDVLEHVAA